MVKERKKRLGKDSLLLIKQSEPKSHDVAGKDLFISVQRTLPSMSVTRGIWNISSTSSSKISLDSVEVSIKWLHDGQDHIRKIGFCYFCL